MRSTTSTTGRAGWETQRTPPTPHHMAEGDPINLPNKLPNFYTTGGKGETKEPCHLNSTGGNRLNPTTTTWKDRGKGNPMHHFRTTRSPTHSPTHSPIMLHAYPSTYPPTHVSMQPYHPHTDGPHTP